MKCRHCNSKQTRVVCTVRHGNETWRYNRCLDCDKTYKTIEVYVDAKRGSVPGQKSHPNSIKKGESNGSSVLTEANIKQIRELANQHMTYHEIARRFGIHKDTVFKIVKRKAWSHV